MVLIHCQGCDDNQPDVKEYDAFFPGQPAPVRACPFFAIG